MTSPSRPKPPGFPPASNPAAAPNQGPRTGAPATAQTPGGATPGGSAPASTGQVVHDSRGGAVWDWLKHTGRQALDSTSRLLKKLEVPELKVEDTHDEELRILPDAPSGGGFDPYNQSTKPRGPIKK
jgi:hypothetical protein